MKLERFIKNYILNAVLAVGVMMVPFRGEAQSATPTPGATATPRPITARCVAPSLSSFKKLLAKAGENRLATAGYTKPKVSVKLSPAKVDPIVVTGIPSQLSIAQAANAPLELSIAGTSASQPVALASCAVTVAVKITARGTKDSRTTTGRSSSTMYVRGTYK